MIDLWTTNDWEPLEAIVVGTTNFARFPSDCPDFREQEKTTKWKHSPLPSGCFPDAIVRQAENSLDKMCQFLKEVGVQVYRPTDLNFNLFDGMYNYCPRDRVLIIENVAIVPNMMFPSRNPEVFALEQYIGYDYIECYDPLIKFDAANVCRVNEKLLYLVSDSGSKAGAFWLQETLDKLHEEGRLQKKYEVVSLNDIYGGVHIDSTITTLREGLVILNKDRISRKKVPNVFKNWDIIWLGMEDMPFKTFYQYPYASEYIGMNILSINPNAVIADIQGDEKLKNIFDKHEILVCDLDFPHSRTLGGGPHCTTLDLRRSKLL